MLIVLIGIVLAGCSDKEDAISGDTVEDVSTSPSEPKPTPIEPNALGNLVEIKILPPEGQLSVPANSKMKLRIIGVYENGEEDLTEQAELRIIDNVSNITFTEDNQVQAGVWDPLGASHNNTRIEAEFEGVRAELTVNVMEGVCDKALTLDQVESADGTCVMSYTYDGKEYLFVPRVKFMDRLGYAASDIRENEGRTYGGIHSGLFPYVLFRRDGKGITWDNYLFENNPYGQAERFCNDLAQMSFNNKDGWEISTYEELDDIINQHIDNDLYEFGGLPLHYFSIWSTYKSLTEWAFYTHAVGEAGRNYRYLGNKHAVVCRSE